MKRRKPGTNRPRICDISLARLRAQGQFLGQSCALCPAGGTPDPHDGTHVAQGGAHAGCGPLGKLLRKDASGTVSVLTDKAADSHHHRYLLSSAGQIGERTQVGTARTSGSVVTDWTTGVVAAGMNEDLKSRLGRFNPLNLQ